MTIPQMPLAAFLGIHETNFSDYLLELPFDSKLLNHIETIHASVIYSLAEISSGVFLYKNFQQEAETTVPLVRKSVIKYTAIPKNDSLYTKAFLVNQEISDIKQQLENIGKVAIEILVIVYDVTEKVIGRCNVNWFVAKEFESLKVSQTASLS